MNDKNHILSSALISALGRVFTDSGIIIPEDIIDDLKSIQATMSEDIDYSAEI